MFLMFKYYSTFFVVLLGNSEYTTWGKFQKIAKVLFIGFLPFRNLNERKQSVFIILVLLSISERLK